MLELYGGESVCSDVSTALGLADLDEFTVTGLLSFERAQSYNALL